jgi:hypothetical protein
MTATAWLTIEDYPPRPTTNDLLSFFGIPPSSPSELDDNINKKRRFWHKAAQTAPPEGRERALAISQAIKEAANALKRGAEAQGGGAASDSTFDASAIHDPRTIDELWRVIQRLIFRQRFREAVELARAGSEKWPTSTEPFVAFAWTVQMAIAQGSTDVAPTTLGQAINVLEMVMRTTGGVREYRIMIGLLQAAGRTDDALRTSYEAEKALQPFPADMLGVRVALLARNGDLNGALVTAAAAVHRNPSDDGTRAECVDALLRFAIDRLLPVRTQETAAVYGRLVRVAAWCAQGVPDLEDRVRLHRLWAANCGQRVFAGNPALRSFVAIISGFTLLPVYNAMASRPSWQVLLDGPASKGRAKRRKMRNAAFYQVASSPHVYAVHETVSQQLPWTESGQWPDLEPLLKG